MAVKIDTLMLNYFVPFGFRCDNDAMFNNAAGKIKKNHKSASALKTGENDFFANVCKLYDAENQAGIGEYIEPRDNLPKLISADGKHSVEFTKCGIYLHRNGLGILSFEIKPSASITDDVHTLYCFQNSFKELTVHKNPFMWQKAEHKRYEYNGKPEEKRIVKDKKEITAISEKIGFDIADKIPEKAVILENGKVIIEYTECSPFHQGMWVYDLLKEIDGLHFMPERYTGDARTPIPDKSLLCNYSLFSADTDEERMDYMFRMTSGYNENYKRSSDIDNDCLKPFENTWWYARQEGMGQFVLLDNNPKRTAFHRDLALKRMENYMYLYVLVLQQHYSLLEYSERIGRLSAVVNNKKGKEHLKELHRCVDDMNVFFMKNTFPGVSHISHQNEVYKYLRNIYDINEFFDETKNGLEAVADMAEKYRNEHTSDRLFLCTIIGAVFVVAETLVNFTELSTQIGFGKEGSLDWWLTVAGLMAVSLIASLFVWFIWKGCKK